MNQSMESLGIAGWSVHLQLLLRFLTDCSPIWSVKDRQPGNRVHRARQPEAKRIVSGLLVFVGLAFAETSGIYGLLIAIIMLYANPLMDALFNLIR